MAGQGAETKEITSPVLVLVLLVSGRVFGRDKTKIPQRLFSFHRLSKSLAGARQPRLRMHLTNGDANVARTFSPQLLDRISDNCSIGSNAETVTPELSSTIFTATCFTSGPPN
ncbi:hypothetical protein BRADI_4g05741v3 [Brachypodium distachyon]|uniref:Uncharacterized protein n=1 Tax=Brachypodium distachyon TaxID=15368 RepID=A0A2K2CKP9_BRADI|nr:hypothetical protein BRADI_4g05741v3 [Brachypodium distachyon]